jgi:cell wall-associated NlpC family hydrolase
LPEVRLTFAGVPEPAVAAAESVAAAQDQVAAAATAANEKIAASAETSARTVAEAAASNIAKAAAQREELAQLAAQYVEALRLAGRAYAEGGSAAQKEAEIAIAAEKNKQTWIERTTALIIGQAKAQREAAGAAGASGAERGAERGLLGATTKEAGFGRVLGGPAVVGGFVAGISILEIVKSTLSAQQSQAQLRNALKDTGNSWASQRKQINETLDAQEKVSGFTRTDLRDALTSLIRRTGDAEKSQKDLAIATNLARGAHIDLGRAVTITTRAEQGNVGQLARLGINIPKVTTNMDALKEAHIKVTDANRAQVIALTKHAQALDKQATATKALDQLEAKYAGAAAARSHTLAGQWEDLKNMAIDYSVQLGTKLIPMLTSLLSWFVKLVDSIKNNTALMNVLRGTFKAFGEGVRVVYDFVKGLWESLSHGQKVIVGVTGAVVALTLVAEANPFIALATGTLIAIGLIKRHWSGIVTFFRGIWKTISDDAQKLWDWMKEQAIKAALAIVEPFSHIPGSMGRWARRAKDAMHVELEKIKEDAANIGSEAGDQYGTNFVASATAAMQKGLVSGALAGDVKANPNAATQAAGTQFGLTTVARSLGVGSGGVYKAGGGHSGIAKPGSVFDCSGYTYQVYTQNGFKDFPSTSESQWSTMEGPNWTSQVIERGKVQAGDLIFMVGSGYASPGHVGIVVSGTGNSADVMQYYSTGRPADTITLGSVNDFVGAKRFYLVKHSTGGSTKPPATKPPSAADTLASEIAAAKAAAGPGKAPKGLSAAAIVSVGAAVTAEVKRVNRELNAAGLAETPGERKLIERLQRLRDELHKGLGSVETAKIKAQMHEVTTALNAEVSERVKAHAKEEAAAKRAASAFRRSLTPLKSSLAAILTSTEVDTSTSGLPSAIGTAVTDLTKLGDPIDSAAKKIVDRLRRLRDQLNGIRGHGAAAIADRDKIKAQIKEWGNALNDELQRQLTRAQEIQARSQTLQARGWRDLTAQLMRSFSAQTSAYDTQFNRDTQAQLDRMTAETQARLQAATALVKTMYGTFTIGVGGLTPAEQALQNLQQSTESTNLQQTLDDAQKELDRQMKIGDPGQIELAKRAVVAAQTAIAEAQLQVQAQTERTAADAALQAEQDRIQKEADVQAQAFQDQRQAQLDAYDQQRADQAQALQDQLDDWQTWLANKAKTYQQFLSWYAAQYLGSPPSSFTSSVGAPSGPGQGAAGGVTGLPGLRFIGGVAGRTGVELATGGFFRTPLQAVVASHEPEFVVPESWLPPLLREQLQGVLAAHKAPGARPIVSPVRSTLTSSGGGADGGGYIYAPVFVNGSVVAEKDLALALRDHLVTVGRQSGGNVFGGQA